MRSNKLLVRMLVGPASLALLLLGVTTAAEAAPVAPQPPSNVSASADFHAGVTVSWTPPAATGGSALVGFEVTLTPDASVNTGASTIIKEVSDPAATSLLIEPVHHGLYDVTVSARNATSASVPSGIVTVSVVVDPTITANADAHPTYMGQAVITGHIDLEGKPFAGASIDISYLYNGADFELGKATADAAGNFRYSYQIPGDTVIDVSYHGAPTQDFTGVGLARVTLKPAIMLGLTVDGSHSRFFSIVKRGKTLTFREPIGVPMGVGTVEFQYRHGSTWVTLRHFDSSKQQLVSKVGFTASGARFAFRWHVAANPGVWQESSSPAKMIVVA